MSTLNTGNKVSSTGMTVEVVVVVMGGVQPLRPERRVERRGGPRHRDKAGTADKDSPAGRALSEQLGLGNKIMHHGEGRGAGTQRALGTVPSSSPAGQLWASVDLGVPYPAPSSHPHLLTISPLRPPPDQLWGGDPPEIPKTPQSQTPS